MSDHIKRAIEILNQGGIVILPTDTAFAIGCKVSDTYAVEKLFTLRRRAETKAVPVLIDSLEMVKKYVTDIPVDVREKLMEKYWPGALTIVLPLQSRVQNIASLVVGRGNTIGLRLPDHSITREIIRGVGEGIVGCSANFAGEATPFRFEDLDTELIKLVDYVVPGETILQQASTVIDCSANPWKILREGAVVI
jgi:L-threonylcarbamoyladenylate synthase